MLSDELTEEGIEILEFAYRWNELNHCQRKVIKKWALWESMNKTTRRLLTIMAMLFALAAIIITTSRFWEGSLVLVIGIVLGAAIVIYALKPRG